MIQSSDWFARSILVTVLLCELMQFSYCVPDLNTHNAQRFEKCVSTILSRYHFLSKQDKWRMNKMLQKSKARLAADTDSADAVKEIRRFGKDLASFVIVDDSWKNMREVAYISAIERCSMLVTGRPDFDLLKEAIAVVPQPENAKYDGFGRRTLGLLRKEGEQIEKSYFSEYNATEKLQGRFKRDLSIVSAVPPPRNNQRQFDGEPVLESVIRNGLLNSPIFNKNFHSGMLSSDTIGLSTVITEAGLVGFNAPVINDALNAVAHDISHTASSSNSEHFAFVIARAIAAILRNYNLILFADGRQITDKMLHKLDAIKINHGPVVAMPLPQTIQRSNSRAEAVRTVAFSQTKPLQPPFISPPISTSLIQPSRVTMVQPETPKLRFRNTLAHLLSESRELSIFFCNSPSTDIFKTVKTALSDFGLLVSLNAAIAVTNALDELEPSVSCSQYSNIIAEVIANIFFDNDLLESIEPAEVMRRLVSSSNLHTEAVVPQRSNPVFSDSAGSSLSLLPSFSEVSPSSEQHSISNPVVSGGEIPEAGIHPSGVFNPFIQMQNTRSVEDPNLSLDFAEDKEILPIQTSSAISETHFQGPGLQPQLLNQLSEIGRDATDYETYNTNFKMALEQALSNSSPFLNTFKTGIVPNAASSFASVMIKPILFQHGPSIHTDVGQHIQRAFSNLPADSLSSNYASAFASSFTDALSKHELLRDMNPETVANILISELEKEIGTRPSFSDSFVFKNDDTQPTVENYVVNSTTETAAPFLSDSENPEFETKNEPHNDTRLIPEERATDVDESSQFPLSTVPLNTIQDSSSTISMTDSARESTVSPLTSISTEVLTEVTSEGGFISTFMEAMEHTSTTQDPYIEELTEAIDDPSKLSSLLMAQIKSTLDAFSGLKSSLNNKNKSRIGGSSETVDNSHVDSSSEDLKGTKTITQNRAAKIEDSDTSFKGPIKISEGVLASSTSNVNAQSDGESIQEYASAKAFISNSEPAVQNRPNSNPATAPPIQKTSRPSEEQDSDVSSFADRVLYISESSITFLRSPQFNLEDLCHRMNELAGLVGIPSVPDDNCSEIPLVDYMLNVLRKVTMMLRHD